MAGWNSGGEKFTGSAAGWALACGGPALIAVCLILARLALALIVKK